MRLHLTLLLPLALALACNQPARREPVPGHQGEPARTTDRRPAPEPEEPGELDRQTAALLERLLVEDTPGGGPTPHDPAADPRPLALLAEWELGAGPFRVAEREVPPAAVRYSLALSLERRFAASGPLAGPLVLEPGELALAAPLPEPLPADLCAAARARGADYILSGRIERMDEESQELYLQRSRRRVQVERARLAFSYRLFELATGRALCVRSFERTFDLDGLPPDELASAEWVLAWEAARLVRDDVAECIEAGAATSDGE